MAKQIYPRESKRSREASLLMVQQMLSMLIRQVALQFAFVSMYHHRFAAWAAQSIRANILAKQWTPPYARLLSGSWLLRIKLISTLSLLSTLDCNLLCARLPDKKRFWLTKSSILRGIQLFEKPMTWEDSIGTYKETQKDGTYILSFPGLMAASVRAEGTVLVYGAMGGIASTNISIRDTMFRGVSVTGFWLSRYLPALGAEGQRRVVTEVLELLEKGILKPRAGEGLQKQKASVYPESCKLHLRMHGMLVCLLSSCIAFRHIFQTARAVLASPLTFVDCWHIIWFRYIGECS